MQPSKPSLLTTILIIGLMAGTLDALGAIVVYGARPAPMFQFIASGAFGKQAFAGGTPMVVAGVLFHYLIAFAWTILFFVLYPRMPLLQRNKPVVIVLYGVVIWLVMNQVVLRLSRIGVGDFDLGQAAIAALILIVMVSLPIVIGASRFYAGKSRMV